MARDQLEDLHPRLANAETDEEKKERQSKLKRYKKQLKEEAIKRYKKEVDSNYSFK